MAVYEHCVVQRVSPDGWLEIGDGAETASKRYRFDWIVNACGPWAVQVLERSALSSPVQLDLVRGSHLLVPVPPGLSLPSEGLFVEVPGSRRIAFLLPYKGELLVGTTEERQELDQPIVASAEEQQELYRLVEPIFPVGYQLQISMGVGFQVCGPLCEETRMFPQRAVKQRFTASDS